MWDWLANNPEMDKEDWPEWEMNGGEYDDYETNSLCFACQYDSEARKPNQNCSCCPIEIGDCNTENSLYNSWYHAQYVGDTKVVVECAEKIRDAKVKEGVEVE